MFLAQIQNAQGKTIVWNDDGTISRDTSDEGIDNVITQLLVKQPQQKSSGNDLELSDEKIASLNTKA